jgi:hypothetical protein
LVHLLNEKIQSQLRLGYDIGKGYVTCNEDVYNVIDELIENSSLAEKIKELLQQSKARMMRELGKTPRLALYVDCYTVLFT